MEATPTVLLAMWASGLAAGGAAVAWWDVVGRGYVWLSAGVAALVGVGLALVEPGLAPWVGSAAAVTAAFGAAHRRLVSGLLGVAAILLLMAGLTDSPVVPLLTGAVLLGFVTTEMMLGHWFLVDPTLPRWSLNRLAGIGGIGLIADVVFLSAAGAASGGVSDPVLGWAYLALTVMTALLVVGVYLSLREPSYTGVMAATGLSYLAVLTSFGVAVLGRMLVG